MQGMTMISDGLGGEHNEDLEEMENKCEVPGIFESRRLAGEMTYGELSIEYLGKS